MSLKFITMVYVSFKIKDIADTLWLRRGGGGGSSEGLELEGTMAV